MSVVNSLLRRAGAGLRHANPAVPVVAVFGSGAADADSVAGCLAYACLLDREAVASVLILPCLPISPADLALRPELHRLFAAFGVKESGLIFCDEIGMTDLINTRRGKIVLVDTQGCDLAAAVRGRVREIIDHHEADPKTGDKLPNLDRRIIEPVGSVCTLVAEQIFLRAPGILDSQLAGMLAAVVRLDTADLDPGAGRASARDREIVDRLRHAGAAEVSGLYAELVQVRADTEGLSSEQLLRKDYKESVSGWTRMGLSSVPLLLDAWSRRDPDLEQALWDFARGRGLDLLVVCLYRTGSVFRRQLILCSGRRELIGRIAASGLGESLGLREISGEEHYERRAGRSAISGGAAQILYFQQMHTSFSRKRIEPILQRIVGAP